MILRTFLLALTLISTHWYRRKASFLPRFLPYIGLL